MALFLNVGGPDLDGWQSDDNFVTQFDGGLMTADIADIKLDSNSTVPTQVFSTGRRGSCQWNLPIADLGWYDIALWWLPFAEPPSEYDSFGVYVAGTIEEDNFSPYELSGALNTPVGIAVPVLLDRDSNIFVDIMPGAGGDTPYLQGISVIERNDPLEPLDEQARLDEIIERINYLSSLERTRRLES